MIETERLRLIPIDADSAAAIAEGNRAGRAWHPDFPREDDGDAARMSLPTPDPVFCSYLIEDKESGLGVGTIGYYGPPGEAGDVMIGYGLVEAARGRGYATEALQGLVVQAFAQPSVRTLLADPLPDNAASHRVLEKAGFTHTHSTDDAHWYALSK
jgi:ribosomal-protein-alanine N-acetyltransferase